MSNAASRYYSDYDNNGYRSDYHRGTNDQSYYASDSSSRRSNTGVYSGSNNSSSNSGGNYRSPGRPGAYRQPYRTPERTAVPSRAAAYVGSPAYAGASANAAYAGTSAYATPASAAAYATPASAAAYATPASAAAYAGASAYATPAPASAAATSAGQYNRQSVAVQPERTYPEAEPRPRLREVPGTRPARKAALPRLGRRILIALAAAGLIFVATGISCAALSSSTSHTMKANDTLQQNINEAYSIANSNAARYAALINPDNIQRQASDLGMAVDPDPEVLELGASQ